MTGRDNLPASTLVCSDQFHVCGGRVGYTKEPRCLYYSFTPFYNVPFSFFSTSLNHFYRFATRTYLSPLEKNARLHARTHTCTHAHNSHTSQLIRSLFEKLPKSRSVRAMLENKHLRRLLLTIDQSAAEVREQVVRNAMSM